VRVASLDVGDNDPCLSLASLRRPWRREERRRKKEEKEKIKEKHRKERKL